MAKPKYKRGQVIWAEVPDRNGVVKADARPVLVTLLPSRNKKGPLGGIAISTRRDLDPADPVVEMPWDAQTGSTTGLYQWCAAVLLWFVLVPQETIECVSGHVTDAFLQDVEQKVQFARLQQIARSAKAK